MTELKQICVMSAALLLVASARVGASSATAATKVGGTVATGPFAVSRVDPACKPLLDANNKTLDTANHMYTDRPGPDGKKTTGEMITVNGDRYLLMHGKWNKSRMTVAATKQQEEENIKDAKVLSCKQTGNDTVNGEAATVYTEHTENDESKSDGKIWVSKSRGVILKEEIVLDAGEGTKQQISTRYEYGNVKAPI